MSYKKINTQGNKPEDFQIEVVDVTVDNEIEIEEEQLEAPEVEEVEEVALEEAVPPKAVVKKKPSGSSAQDRIRELANARKKEAEEKTFYQQELEKERKTRQELEERLQSTVKTSKTDLKTSLTNQLKSLSRDLSQAMQDGDSEATVAINQDIIDVKMSLAGLEAELHRIETATPVKADTTEVKQPAQPRIPKKAIQWLEASPHFFKDPVFEATALAVSNSLVSEGFSDETDAFYTELDNRLAKRFSEYYTIDSQEEEVEEEEEVVEEPKPVVKKKVTQVVSSSRATPQKGNKARSGETIQLSQKDIAQAKRWNISLEQMARRIAHINKTKDHTGYTPINITKE